MEPIKSKSGTQNSSRITKLKKLYRLSSQIIHQFGISYFLNVASEEFNKQKFDLFKSDFKLEIHEEEKLDNLIRYQIWKQNQEKLNETVTIQNKISGLNLKPKITIIYTINQTILCNLEKSIKSIQNQIYENWELIIISKELDLIKQFKENTEKQILDDTRITIFSDSDYDTKFLNKVIFKSTGEFLGFLSDGDILTKDALFQIICGLNEKPTSDILYTDEDQINAENNRINPFFKPDWCPYLFLSMNYLERFCLIRRKIFDQVKGFRALKEFSALYDLILRCSELTPNITHISLTLCGRLVSTNEEFDYPKGAKKIISDALERRQIKGTVENGLFPKTFRIKFTIEKEPLVTIIIPTRDQKPLLQRCLKSIERNTSYKNWEIIIVDNNSKKEDTRSYLSSLPYQVIRYELPFNFSKINNLAASKANGEYLLFLNDDTQALGKEWLGEMVSICHQKDVGVVGAKLIFTDDTIQHAGMVFLKNGSGFHPFQRKLNGDFGYFGFLNVVRDYSSVTGACLLVKKSIFQKVGLFDENFDLYYGDSDLCFKIKKLGFNVIYTPYALLRHDGSSKIREFSKAFFAVENYHYFIKRWPFLKKGDPCYNPNLDWDYNISLKL